MSRAQVGPPLQFLFDSITECMESSFTYCLLYFQHYIYIYIYIYIFILEINFLDFYQIASLKEPPREEMTGAKLKVELAHVAQLLQVS